MHRLNISCLFYIFSTMLSKILRLNGLRNFSILFFGVVLLKDDMKFLSGIIHLSLKCILVMIMLSNLFVIACRDSEHGGGIVDMYLLLTSAT